MLWFAVLLLSAPHARYWSPKVAEPADVYKVKANVLGLGANDEIRVASEVQETGIAGLSVQHFQHYFKGMRVLGSESTLFLRAGNVIGTSGNLVTRMTLDTSLPRRNESEALIAAKNATHAHAFGPIGPAEVVVAFAQVDRMRMDPRVAYRFTIPTRAPDDIRYVVVDASSLQVLRHSSATSHTSWDESTASGASLYDGVVTIDAQSTGSPATYRLHSMRGQEIAVYDLNLRDSDQAPRSDISVSSATCRGASVETCSHGVCTGNFTQSTCSSSSIILKAGVEALWAAQATVNYFKATFGRPYFTFDKLPLAILINPTWWLPSKPPSAATLHPNNREHRVVIAGPSAISNHSGSLMVIAHELSHLYMQDLARLDTSGESGALDEVLADIFGLNVDFANNPSADWKVGEQVFTNGSCMRNIPKLGRGPGYPNSLSPNDLSAGCPGNGSIEYMPNTYRGTSNWRDASTCDDTNDYCWVHTNMGPGDYWFWLITHGCTSASCVNNADPPQSYQVVPISLQEATAIAYAGAAGIASQGGYADMREQTILAAMMLYGPYSVQHAAVADAWHAVGVGDAYVSPEMLPQDGSVDVEPWEAELTFDMGAMSDGGEVPCFDSYQALISKNPDMSNSRTLPFEFDGIRGVIHVPLSTGSTYYWEVRDGVSKPDGSCSTGSTRGVHSFTTSKKKADAVAPTKTTPCTNTDKRYPSKGVCYPWSLDFEWKPVTGAEYYQFTIVHDGTKVQHITQSDTKLTTNALVKKRHQVWSVVPVGPLSIYGDETKGEPTETEFETVLPITEEVEPNGGIPYPWLVRHEWAPVPGATFDFTLYRSSDTIVTQALSLAITHFDFAVDANGSTYHWSVLPRGPYLPLLGTSEEGELLESYEYDVDVMATAPTLDPPSPLCAPEGDVTLSWDQVTNAESYKVTFLDWDCTVGLNCASVYESDPWAHSVPAGHSHSVSASLSLPNLRSDAAVGFEVTVESVGPSGAKGAFGTTHVFVQPEMPQVQAPWNGIDIYKDQQFFLQFMGKGALGGEFEIVMYSDTICHTPWAKYPIAGDATGVNQWALYFSMDPHAPDTFECELAHAPEDPPQLQSDKAVDGLP